MLLFKLMSLLNEKSHKFGIGLKLKKIENPLISSPINYPIISRISEIVFTKVATYLCASLYMTRLHCAT